MDHVRAQQVISDALDELAVDRWELSEAKEHCRACPECASYVRALIAVQRTPLPEPSADLPDRVMAQVRKEAQTRAIARARALASPKKSNAAEKAAADQGPRSTSVRDLWDRARDPRNRRQVAIWGGVAASVFIVAGWGAIVGVRAILVPPRISEMTIVGTDKSTQPYTAPTGVPEQNGRASDSLLSGEAEAPGMIEVAGRIYRLNGTNVSVDKNALRKVGQTRTALDTGRMARSYDVFTGTDPFVVYVAADDVTFEFKAITRDYQDKTYVLQGSSIERYGDWPGLPASLKEPTSTDGSPTFEISGTDDNNISTYQLRGGTAAEGIALAPNPPTNDPMAGCPNWTWWAPSQ